MKALSSVDEKELVQKLRAGDAWALEQVYNTYADMLAYKLHKLIKIEAVIEELHQDVFLKLWNGRHNLAADTNLKAYLLVIAKNLAMDFYRRAAKDRELERQLVAHLNLGYDHIEPLLEAKETSTVLEQLIALLPPQRQRVFRLIKQQGKSYEEASLYFGVSMSTIKDHMAKSSDFIRRELSKNYPDILFGMVLILVFK